MRYRLMATYQGVPYEAGIGPAEDDVVLFAACPPPEELGFEPATGHWRKQLRMADIQALWESRPTGTFRGGRCMILDDLGDRLHIAYLGHDAYQAERMGYWQVDRGVFELVAPREEVVDVVEERSDYPYRDAGAGLAGFAGPAGTTGTAGLPGTGGPGPAGPASGPWSGPPSWPGADGSRQPGAAGPDRYPPATNPSAPYRTAPHPILPQSLLPGPGEPGSGVPGPGPASGQSQPGFPQPGFPQPGLSQPAPSQPALSQPALSQPGLPQPGLSQGGAAAPGHEPGPDAASAAAARYREPPLPLEAAALRATSAAARRRSRGADEADQALDGPRRRADRPRLTTERNFTDLANLARIPASAYAVGSEVDGAMCLVPTTGGFEVFTSADGARHEVRLFADEESAYFYLFGVLAAEAVRTGGLLPGR